MLHERHEPRHYGHLPDCLLIVFEIHKFSQFKNGFKSAIYNK